MPDSEITTKQDSKPNGLILAIIGSSIPIVLVVAGIIKALLSEAHGIVDTTTEQAVFFWGLFVALPCGILDIVLGIKGRSKRLISKGIAITGIIIGVLSVVAGLISWIWYFMIAAFSAAFS